MKYLSILALCIFIISISVITFAEQPAQIDQPKQDTATEEAEESPIMEEAKRLPSTLMTDEEARSKDMQEVEELRSNYVFDEDPLE